MRLDFVRICTRRQSAWREAEPSRRRWRRLRRRKKMSIHILPKRKVSASSSLEIFRIAIVIRHFCLCALFCIFCQIEGEVKCVCGLSLSLCMYVWIHITAINAYLEQTYFAIICTADIWIFDPSKWKKNTQYSNTHTYTRTRHSYRQYFPPYRLT